ncbi:glycosyltransferase [Serratia sp. S1B]|nr:glycosyltransferase [Serratia sp. S1B]
MNENRMLFVNIASYRDPELIPTLKDMLAMVKKPQNLRIAICWQHDDPTPDYFTNSGMTLLTKEKNEEHSLWCFEWQQAHIEVIAVHYLLSQGACWARYWGETRYAGEDFVLQIDSHCRFVRHWDSEMIAMLDDLRTLSAKPVLSTYPPPYQPDQHDEKRGSFTSRLIFREFSKEGLPMLSSTPVNSDVPVRNCYLAGGFIFADGNFVREVANDPQIFFAGEEIAMAARAWTHGYDIYTPHKILLWHYYERKQEPKVWGDLNREAKDNGEVRMAWWERDAISKKRICSLFGLEESPVESGNYGLGTIRTLTEFERHIGVDFRRRAVLPEVLGKEKVSFIPPENQINDADWEHRLLSPFQKHITLKKSEIGVTSTLSGWWYLGIYCAKNRLLEEKKLSASELKVMLDKSEGDEFKLDINFSTRPQQAPSIVRLCSFDETNGWGDVVEKTW